MILYLNKNFNEDLLNEVIDFYNKKPTDVQIYLNSNGGFKPYQVAIQHIIEQSNIPTSLYAFDYIASSAVDFFFTLNTKDKKILEGCNAMIHQSTIQVFLNEKMNFTAGTVIVGEKTMPGFEDKTQTMQFIKETGNVELLQQRLSSTAVKEYMDNNNGQLPPGVKVVVERTVTIRRK